jgi:hypothetical protein
LHRQRQRKEHDKVLADEPPGRGRSSGCGAEVNSPACCVPSYIFAAWSTKRRNR